jgi:hypothetical protein
VIPVIGVLALRGDVREHVVALTACDGATALCAQCRYTWAGEPALQRGEVEPTATAHHQLTVEHDVAQPRTQRVDHLREESGERRQLARLRPDAALGDGGDRPNS